jgi:Tfp pilus assembly protein PilF
MAADRFKEHGADPQAALRRAEAIASDAIRQAPDVAVAHKARAFALQKLAERDEAGREELRADADREYDEALRLNPRYVFAANNLGYLRLTWAKELRQGGRHREAAAKLDLAEESLFRAESHRHALCNLGELWLERYRLKKLDAEVDREGALLRAREYLQRAIDASAAGGTAYPEAENLLAIDEVLSGRKEAFANALADHRTARRHVTQEYSTSDDADGRDERLAGLCAEFAAGAAEALGVTPSAIPAADGGECGCEDVLAITSG